MSKISELGIEINPYIGSLIIFNLLVVDFFKMYNSLNFKQKNHNLSTKPN